MINGNLKSTYASDEEILNNSYKKAFFIAAVIAAALVPLIGSDYLVLIAAQMGIFLLAAIGVNVVIGYTGLLSLGHGGFVALGAYGVVLIHHGLTAMGVPEAVQPILAVGGAMALAAGVGIIVGLPSLRVKGVYLAVATLSANFIILFLIELEALGHWTGGKSGLTTVDPVLFGWSIDTQKEVYALIAVMGFATILMVQNLFRTRVGRAFIAIRERDYSAEILGVSLLRYKLTSFAISAACCGLAGAMTAYFYARILPEQFGLMLSLQLVAALVVGGMGRTLGPVFGVIIIVMAPEVLKFVFATMLGSSAEAAQLRAPLQEIIFGGLIIGFIMFEPLGIAQIIDRVFKKLNQWPFARG